MNKNIFLIIFLIFLSYPCFSQIDTDILDIKESYNLTEEDNSIAFAISGEDFYLINFTILREFYNYWNFSVENDIINIEHKELVQDNNYDDIKEEITNLKNERIIFFSIFTFLIFLSFSFNIFLFFFFKRKL